MILEMKVPSPGESITEVEIAQWLVADGDYVEKDQAIAEVDSDKATLELPAEDKWNNYVQKQKKAMQLKWGKSFALLIQKVSQWELSLRKTPAKKEAPADVEKEVAAQATYASGNLLPQRQRKY